MNKFIHLKVHSEYSIIDSIIKIENLIKKIKLFNMKSVAINDFYNFFGLIKFYEESCKNEIKPIIGIDILINNDFDNNNNNNYCYLTLIACNLLGYKNIISIISESYIKSKKKYNKYPIVNNDILFKYKDEIIVLSGGINGYIGKSIINNNNNNNLKKYINLYLKTFKDKFYLEISRIGLKNEELYINESKIISKKYNISIVATNNVIFINKNEFDIHNIKILINKNIHGIKNNYTVNQYLKSEEEMNNLFLDIPEAIINTFEIYKRCNVILNFDKYYLPKFYKKFKSTEKILYRYSKYKLYKKINEKDNNIDYKKHKIYYDRLYKEIKIINKMGFSGYFLIVMEFIKWSKNNDIPVGPGRGSGTGSLVSYVLNITELDPIKFNLIFERFLNPNRLSMPDFDIDFCVKKRDFVINHIINKYSINNVARIITFNSMTAKSSIKDVGRVLNYPYGFINKITNIIPNIPGMTISKCFKINEFMNLYNENDEIKYLIDVSIKLEGIIKGIGKHAGGIVITPCKITNLIPVYYDNIYNCYITQFDKNDIEKSGLVKFDFLGLKTLSLIDETIKLINIRYNKNININKISLSDKNSFNLLKLGLTNAIFQLESKGIKNIIKKINPNKFEEIIDIIALFRPGPIKSKMVDNYINRKNKKEKIYYPSMDIKSNILKKILYSTYGIILYQEQIIEIAQKFSNYSIIEADLFRIAISKKNTKEMRKQKEKFINGIILKNNNMNYNTSEKIFNIIEKFSGYGFNKSHSTAYAMIAYQTLWLKSNYKKEFMLSIMNLEINNNSKIINLIKECNNLNIKINKININSSKYEFYINKNNEIEYGLGFIKGISENIIKKIIDNRIKYGIYKNMLDFSTRVNLSKIGKKNLEILINNNIINFEKIKNINDFINKYFNISKQYFNNINNKQINLFKNLI
ncbi:DNA-directed DNA polymerase [endosymbiont of Euscepes postfasciatus]|uniref:DNA polymerase III subunit alpha n=1 Tax=endosymbiont of Euscepes postfasciatus TaxID=650377 RepID=UPI000DC728B0|nr:DNA polymerase III subunit alpha [endosymbiont of Euscepes postfasciatus]BBA84731.1 DNA-directed DNA polymerase [endosymbiont of Euscepes postfasciatus]